MITRLRRWRVVVIDDAAKDKDKDILGGGVKCTRADAPRHAQRLGRAAISPFCTEWQHGDEVPLLPTFWLTMMLLRELRCKGHENGA